MPMFVLFAGAGCSASSEVALGGRMVQIIQKYENEIDEEQFNDYVVRKRKQFVEKHDNIELKVELLKSLPLSFQKLIREEKKCADLASLNRTDLEDYGGNIKICY